MGLGGLGLEELQGKDCRNPRLVAEGEIPLGSVRCQPGRKGIQFTYEAWNFSAEVVCHQGSRAHHCIREVAVLSPVVRVGALNGVATAAVEGQGQPLDSHMKGHCIRDPSSQMVGRDYHLGRTWHQAHNHQGPRQEMAQSYCTASEAGVSGLPAKGTPWLWLAKGWTCLSLSLSKILPLGGCVVGTTVWSHARRAKWLPKRSVCTEHEPQDSPQTGARAPRSI